MPSLASFQSVLSRRSSLSHEIRQISPSSCNALQYVYSKLESTQDIRLMTLLPGNFEDLITIELYHVALKPHHPVISAARSIQELTSTLPDGWQANRTTEGRLIFFGARSNEGPQWSHPDPSLDLTDFQLPADGSGEGYEPRYEALSYTWGSPELADTVELYTAEGPRSLGITKNLSIALRYLRVVVWLGPESADSTLACTTIRKIGSQFETDDEGSSLFRSPDWSEPEWNMLVPTQDQWHALENLLKRQWFSRLWTWQEVQLASQQTIVQCGFEQFGWSVFKRVIGNLSRDSSKPTLEFYNLHRNVYGLLGGMSPSDVDRMLLYASLHACSDPKDKVYGILGIVDPAFSQRIRPQYSMSKADVYKNTALAYLDEYGRLDLLRQCGVTSWELDLPSWTPNWTAESRLTALNSVIHRAGGDHSASRTSFLPPDTLEVEAVTCGTITTISRSGIPAMIEASGLREIFHSKQAVRYLTGEPLARAIIATLTTNQYAERFPDIQAGLMPALSTLEIALLRDPCRIGSRHGHEELLSVLDHTDGLDMSYTSIDTSSYVAPRDGPGQLPRKFEYRMIGTCRGRAFLETAEGYIGLGPKETLPGDIVCVLLGYNLPMLLRPTGDGQYQVVGEAYVHGICDGDALLGPLPEFWQIEMNRLGRTFYRVFRNSQTREKTGLDHRLGPLPDGWEGIQHPDVSAMPLFHMFKCNTSDEPTKFDPRLSPELLKAKGINLTTFELV